MLQQPHPLPTWGLQKVPLKKQHQQTYTVLFISLTITGDQYKSNYNT